MEDHTVLKPKIHRPQSYSTPYNTTRTTLLSTSFGSCNQSDDDKAENCFKSLIMVHTELREPTLRCQWKQLIARPGCPTPYAVRVL